MSGVLRTVGAVAGTVAMLAVPFFGPALACVATGARLRRRATQVTVVNAWRNGRTGYLFTDTVATDRTSGEVIGFGGKSFYAANWPVVIGATWAGGLIDYLAEPFAKSPPKNLRGLSQMMPRACEHFVERARAEGSDNAFVRAIAVAWCARTRSIRIFHCSTLDEMGGPLETRELNYFIGTGISTPEGGAAQERLRAGKALDPDAEAIALLEAQRREPFQATEGRGGRHAIGGQVVRLTVNRRGVREDIIHEWPDKMGEPIAA